MRNSFIDDFHEILKKHDISQVVLHNMDNDDMGTMQLFKIFETEQGEKWVSLCFSSKGDALCSCFEKCECR